MKSILRTLGVLIAVTVVATSHPAAQAPSLRAELIKDLTSQRDRMAAIADAMPADKFGYKSTDAQRTYGQQILHVAGANVMLFKAMGATGVAPTINQEATDKAEILKALADSYDFGIAGLNAQTDAGMMEAVQGPAFLGSSSRVRLANFAMVHAMDIYGQMAVYLRLNGIVPPASRNSM